MSAKVWLRVAVDVPLFALFDYYHCEKVAIGRRVIVPFGRRKVIGVVVEHPEVPDVPEEQLKAVEVVIEDLPPCSNAWMRLARFAAAYYQRPLGEVMLPVMPASLRRVSAYQGKRSRGGPVARMDRRAPPKSKPFRADAVPDLTAEQQEVLTTVSHHLAAALKPILLHGVTGSGKTEIYLQLMLRALRDNKQVLFLVPEINLTPQLEAAIRARLAVHSLSGQLAVLHSGLAEGARLRAWVQTLRGEARVLLGTRLAVFAEMPDLGLIIVDEEHDPSYKQQEGLRYSARDLAVWRGHDLSIPVVLGSATPSLESWQHSIAGRYQKVSLHKRAKPFELPTIRLIDTRRLALNQGFSPHLLEAMEARLLAGEQVLVFLNRRGYAPVLSCPSCGWLSQCVRCSTYTVMHRRRQAKALLQCHHCGYHARVPLNCPDCGDPDLTPVGRGTQRVEDFLTSRFEGYTVTRIDADSTRTKGSADALFSQVHMGEIDILVGTQMVSKGHDFERLGLVGVLNSDSMLFHHDFRVLERLFSHLMQVSGRAGRHLAGAEVMIQTNYPDQPIYQALRQHDYSGFAQHLLEERRAAALPPFTWQALLIAQAKHLQTALDFLTQAAQLVTRHTQDATPPHEVLVYDPVPLRLVRVANVERAQLLLEAGNRRQLQALLSPWSRQLEALAKRCRVRYVLEVDPLDI